MIDEHRIRQNKLREFEALKQRCSDSAIYNCIEYLLDALLGVWSVLGVIIFILSFSRINSYRGNNLEPWINVLQQEQHVTVSALRVRKHDFCNLFLKKKLTNVKSKKWGLWKISGDHESEGRNEGSFHKRVNSNGETSKVISAAAEAYNAVVATIVRAPPKDLKVVSEEWAAIRIQTAFRGFLVTILHARASIYCIFGCFEMSVGRPNYTNSTKSAKAKIRSSSAPKIRPPYDDLQL